MARRAKATKKKATLPNAPLIEAVFELKWELQKSDANQPLILQTDPGFFALQETFTKKMNRLGFSATRDMAGSNTFAGGYSVSRRYYQAEDKPYPLMQIGPGVFATNLATDYEWGAFKKQVLSGVRALLSSYPKMIGFPLKPIHLELRYVDVIEVSVIGDVGFLEFIDKATSMKLDTGPFLSQKSLFHPRDGGRITVYRNLKRKRSSLLEFEVVSGLLKKSEAVVRINSKVRSTDKGVPALAAANKFLPEINKWLDFAHDILSPLFKDVMKPDVMAKFRG